jgi:hypothetical protein
MRNLEEEFMADLKLKIDDFLTRATKEKRKKVNLPCYGWNLKLRIFDWGTEHGFSVEEVNDNDTIDAIEKDVEAYLKSQEIIKALTLNTDNAMECYWEIKL